MLAATAILVGSFNPVLATQAWAATTLIDPVPAADTTSSDTLEAMQNQCDTLAAAHGTGNGDEWTGEVVEGAVTLVSGPTEVGNHTIDDALPGTLHGAGTFTPGTVSILGDPYRNGGSVNMFGVQQATGGHYSASTYDFSADFTTVYAHAFSCNILQAVYHPAVDDPGHAVEGYYVVHVDEQGNEEGSQQSCNAFTANGPDWPFWGQDHAQCDFVKTADAEPPSHEDAYLDEPVQVGNEAGVAVNQEQTDTLTAHEDAGEGYDVSETVLIGQAVICISPSGPAKKGVPGVWKQQNGYTGNKCTTAWFNVAPWGHGSQDSNGTYISVPLI